MLKSSLGALALVLAAAPASANETVNVVPSNHPFTLLSAITKVVSLGTQKVEAEEFGKVDFNVRAITLLDGSAMNSYSHFITFSAGELNAATYALQTRFMSVPRTKTVAGRPGTYQVKGLTYDFGTEKETNVCFLITAVITDAYQMPDALSVVPCKK